MPVNVHICDAILEKVHPESCFQKILASVADAVFCGDSTYVDISCIEKFEDFRQWLVCMYLFKRHKGILSFQRI